MTDADVDGAHIRTLLLTLFFRHFPQLIEGGHIYIAQPPLFKVSKGKKSSYAYSDRERDSLINDIMTSIKEASDDKAKKLATKEQKPSAETAQDLARLAEDVTGAENENQDELAENPLKKAGINIQRYKGLGEMDADQLRETTMDPDARTLRRITIKDATAAESMFELLMGNDVAPRKEFISTAEIDRDRIDA